MMTKTNGKKSMQANLETKQDKQLVLKQAVESTLAFFALYEVPVSLRRIHELLLNQQASEAEIQKILDMLISDNRVYRAGNLYSFKPWKASDYRDKQIEISKKWHKIDRYFRWLSLLPYVRMVAVINSLALGTADADSDIDFFVVTQKRRLYFVRSIIIVVFRVLGVYKTRQKIKDKFCFGFFVTENSLNLEPLLIKPKDPYFLFWLANMRPIIGGKAYWQLMQQNSWLNTHFPNFNPMHRLASAKEPGIIIRSLRFLLEIMLWIPAFLVEPALRKIHITHTFRLAENNTVTSTTKAHADMLKLHGHDVRAKVASTYEDLLQTLR